MSDFLIMATYCVVAILFVQALTDDDDYTNWF